MAGNSGRRKPDGLVMSAPRSIPMFVELNREMHRERAIFDNFATFCDDFVASYEGQPEMYGQARKMCNDFFLYFNMCYYTRTYDYYPLGLSDESVPEYLAPHTRPANRTQPRDHTTTVPKTAGGKCTWFTYSVSGIPITMRDIDGTVYQTSDMIEEEVEHLAGRKADYLRPSFRGPNLRKQEITWIISFLEPVDEFRLFATSNFSRYLGENPAIAYHNPGCQGYCRPSQCTRAIRCSNCGKPERVHDGLMGAECTRPEKCANCHQPYPADHKECPVAPRNHNGEISKEELKNIRAFGDTLYLDVNTRSKK